MMHCLPVLLLLGAVGTVHGVITVTPPPTPPTVPSPPSPSPSPTPNFTPKATPKPDEVTFDAAMFNCLRAGQICQGGQSDCEDTGLCSCQFGLDGFDCAVNFTADALPDEDCTCENKAPCVEDDKGGPVCYCDDPQFYGPMCELERATEECTVDAVEMILTPFINAEAGFTGVIYIVDQADDLNCFFAETDPGTYELAVTFEDCGGAANISDINGDTWRTFKVLVQYEFLYITETDQEFAFSCIIKPPESTMDKDHGDVETETLFDPHVITQELDPLEVQLLITSSMELIEAPVMLGTLITLHLTLHGGEIYDAFRLEYLQVHNALTLEELAVLRVEEFDMVDTACITEVAGYDGNKVVKEFDYLDSAEPVIMVTMKLFKFQLTDRLAFKMTVKLCKDSDGCDPVVCGDGIFDGIGRKRRDVGQLTLLDPRDVHTPAELAPGSKDRFETVQAGLTILVPNTDTPNNQIQGVSDSMTSGMKKPGVCLQNTWVIVCILLTALVCVMIGALAAWMRMRKDIFFYKKEGMEPGIISKDFNTKF